MLPISDKFSHFQYATLEMFKAALNNYSMLKPFEAPQRRVKIKI